MIQKKESRFNIIEGTQYNVILVLVAIGTLLEIPLIHLLIENVMDESQLKDIIQYSLIAISILGLVWTFRDYVKLRLGGIIVDDVNLSIRASFRLSAIISQQNIESITDSSLKIENPFTSDWRQPKEKISDDNCILKIAFEKPNICITFKNPEKLSGLIGGKRRYTSLHFHLASKAEFLKLISEKLMI